MVGRASRSGPRWGSVPSSSSLIWGGGRLSRQSCAHQLSPGLPGRGSPLWFVNWLQEGLEANDQPAGECSEHAVLPLGPTGHKAAAAPSVSNHEQQPRTSRHVPGLVPKCHGNISRKNTFWQGILFSPCQKFKAVACTSLPGQHLITAIADLMFGFKTTSW